MGHRGKMEQRIVIQFSNYFWMILIDESCIKIKKCQHSNILNKRCLKIDIYLFFSMKLNDGPCNKIMMEV